MFDFLERFNLPVGKYFGAPTYVHWSWWLLLPFLFSQSLSIFVCLAVFLLVFLHECGHVFAALRFHCHVSNIVLYPFGGVAATQIPHDPKKEAIIALAGPLINLVLAPGLWLLSDLSVVLWQIHLANLTLMLFNILPAFPMDGGRVFRAVLQRWRGDRLFATKVAARTGQFFAAAFICGGVIFANVILCVIGIFVLASSQMELESERKSSEFTRQSERLSHFRPYDAHWAARESEEIVQQVRERLSRFRP